MLARFTHWNLQLQREEPDVGTRLVEEELSTQAQQPQEKKKGEMAELENFFVELACL